MGSKARIAKYIAPITSRVKNNLRTHVKLESKETGLKCDSTVLMEQIRTIDKSRLMNKMGMVNMDDIEKSLNDAIMVSFGIYNPLRRMKLIKRKTNNDYNTMLPA